MLSRAAHDTIILIYTLEYFKHKLTFIATILVPFINIVFNEDHFSKFPYVVDLPIFFFLCLDLLFLTVFDYFLRMTSA